MKKNIYTIAFIALLSLASNAQTTKKESKAPDKKETVNPDGTLSPTPINEIPQATQAPQDGQESKPQKSGTRMAITEKGVPASKKPADKKTEAPKTEKPQ